MSYSYVKKGVKICLINMISTFLSKKHTDEQSRSSGKPPPKYMRWPHIQADQVHGLGLREIGGGFSRHNRAPSVRGACHAIAKPSTMVQKMQNLKKLRGHRNAVYCGKDLILLLYISPDYNCLSGVLLNFSKYTL